MASAVYFFTICARRPESNLVVPSCAKAITSAFWRMEKDNDWLIKAATIMPDHCHVLATLSGRLKVGQVIGKFKALTNRALAAQAAEWQENFYEHQLRPEDVTGHYARYIFLNPYRANLIDRCNEWPYWMIGSDQDYDFLHMLDEGKWPPAEWISADVRALGVEPGLVGVD